MPQGKAARGTVVASGLGSERWPPSSPRAADCSAEYRRRRGSAGPATPRPEPSEALLTCAEFRKFCFRFRELTLSCEFAEEGGHVKKIRSSPKLPYEHTEAPIRGTEVAVRERRQHGCPARRYVLVAT